MRKRLFTLAAIMLAWFVHFVTVRADDAFAATRAHIQKSLVDETLPSIAVAVAKDGRTVWEEGFGWANRELRVPATEHTMYSIASISKPITATGIMVLVEQDLVKLDRPVNDYLGDAKMATSIGNIDQVTLRTLANHTSGLPVHYQFFYADENYPLPSFDESLRRYGRLVAPPGERYEYANFGYGVLGNVIERHSGLRYGEFLKRNVFIPLGMTHSADGVPSELSGFRAERYGPDQRPLPHYDFDHPGASAIYSSAHDLVRFGSFHLNRRWPDQKAILSDATVDEMQKPTADAGNGNHYGIGWFVAPDEHGYRTVSHSGGMGGVRTRLVLVPDEGIAVAVLCNTSADAPMRIAKRVLADMLPEYARRFEESQAKKKSPLDPPAMIPHGPEELLGTWEGAIETYQGRRMLSLTFKPDGDVHARIDQQLVALVNHSRFKDGKLTGTFQADIGTEDANRKPYHLHLNLRRRDQKLSGAVTAMTLPSHRAGNALSHWAELHHTVDAAGVRNMLAGPDPLSRWKIADKYDFSRHGMIAMRDGELHLEAGEPASGVAWQGPRLQDNYELSLDAQRVAGSDFFCGLTFPVGQEFCTFIAGGWGGGVTGLSNINGMSAVENETTNHFDFETGKWYRIRLKVTTKWIEAWIDDKQMVSVDRQDKKFDIWWEQEPMKPLGIASWNTHAAIRNVQMKPVVAQD